MQRQLSNQFIPDDDNEEVKAASKWKQTCVYMFRLVVVACVVTLITVIFDIKIFSILYQVIIATALFDKKNHNVSYFRCCKWWADSHGKSVWESYEKIFYRKQIWAWWNGRWSIQWENAKENVRTKHATENEFVSWSWRKQFHRISAFYSWTLLFSGEKRI